MLQSIRDRTQGWFAGIVISLLIFSFALWGIHSYFLGNSANTPVAEVNGVEITKSQLAVAYERLRRQLQSQPNSPNGLPSQADAGLKDRALKALINVQVLKQASIQQGYYISSAQVDSFLEKMPEFQVNGQFSVNKFQQALSATLYTPVEFIELIQTLLLIDQPRLGLIFSSFSLPNEIYDTIRLVNQERDIQYFVIPYQHFLSQPTAISEDQIKAYYQSHQNEFKTPEQVSVEYVELSVKELMKQLNVTESELKTFYNENSNLFAKPAQWRLDKLVLSVSEETDQAMKAALEKMNQVYHRAQSGEIFSKLAQTFSLENPKESQKWVTQHQIAVELQKPLTMLTKNQISQPIQINHQWVIVKLLDYQEPELLPFDSVKEKVKEALLHQKAEEKFGEVRERLASLAYEHPDSLQPIANDLGLKIQASELFTQEKGEGDLSSHAKVREAAFGQDVLVLNNNSDVIQKNPESVVVIRVKSHVPSSLLSIKAMRQQIIDHLKDIEINNKTAAFANQLKQKLQSGESIHPEQALLGTDWRQIGFIQRHSTKVDPAILDTAFEMAKPQPGKMVYAVAKLNNGYAIVGLKAIKDASVPTDEYAVYDEQIQNALGLLEYELYKKELMTQAKIK